ncbi:Mu-like prophage protein gp29 [Enterobacter hormaechei]|nr:Mu-like prophage protein gp29 [Enterobacter hormaechei]
MPRSTAHRGVIGKHPRGTAQGEIDLLLDSMEAMVEDAVAAIPDDSSIEIKEAAGKADSSDIYQNLITLARSEISIALLGRTSEATDRAPRRRTGGHR